MSASRSARLAQPSFEQSGYSDWQQKRLELLQPQQRRQLARRRLEAVPYVLLVALVFGAAFAYMCLSARIGATGQEINAIEEQITETQHAAQRLELDIGTLSALSRIESYAKLHLGMVYPDVNDIQYLDQQVNSQMVAELSALKETEPPPPPPVEKKHPLLEAWSALIGYYFSGTALAAE